MAVDTRDKRFSIFSLAQPWVPTLPLVDGGFALQADRQHIAYMYRGIAAEATIFATITGSWSLVLNVHGNADQITVHGNQDRVSVHGNQEGVKVC